MADQPEKMPLTSMDLTEERRAELKCLLPEVFREGKIDFEALKRSLGEWVEPGKERFGLNWPGKAACMQAIQSPSVGTLLPKPEESVNWDTAENLIIEGDNLEVLKLLQTAYHGKVKMIYIDPPYNTGNDFIYPDDYAESLQTYLEYTGQVDAEGRRFSTNTEADGRFHSKWINMMYPRLFLARNLLRADGVIFASIDEVELGHMLALMNEVFGEENREGIICWRRRFNQPNDRTKMIGKVAEFVVAYARDTKALKEAGVGKVDLTGKFSNPDDDVRGDWASKPWKVGSDQSGSQYTITTPSGTVYDEEWMGDENTYKILLADDRIIFPGNGSGAPRKKYFRSEREQEGQCATNWWHHEDFGHNQGANAEMARLFGTKNVFSNPKPTELIRGLIQISNAKEDDIILDFFAGSGPVGQAVLNYNRENNTKLRFLLVQLPELLSEDIKEHRPALTLGYRNIAEVTRDRVRKGIEEGSGEGYRALSLAPSNFKVWEGDATKAADMPEALSLFADHVVEGRTSRDTLYEILLKAGFPLTTPIETLELAGKEVFSVAEGALLVCLEKEITLEVVEAIVARTPQQIICLDAGFQGNDQLKVNAVQTVKARNRSEETDMVFKVV